MRLFFVQNLNMKFLVARIFKCCRLLYCSTACGNVEVLDMDLLDPVNFTRQFFGHFHVLLAARHSLREELEDDR